MKVATDRYYANITQNDLQLASAYFPILVDLARNKQCLTCGELVERAKTSYPVSPVVRNAMSVSTGRKLDVVRLFTSSRGLPDLTCLIINKGAAECGAGFKQRVDPVSARETVFACNWSAVSGDFDGFVKHAEGKVTPRKPIKLQSALKLMSEYYVRNQYQLPVNTGRHRTKIVELLMEGFAPGEAFATAVDSAVTERAASAP